MLRTYEGVAVLRTEECLKFENSAEKSVSISVKTFFLEITCFWAEKNFEFEISAERSVSISIKTFFLFFFSFLEITCFWAEKNFEFEISAEKSVSTSLAVFSTFKKNASLLPFSEILATRLNRQQTDTHIPTIHQNDVTGTNDQHKANMLTNQFHAVSSAVSSIDNYSNEFKNKSTDISFQLDHKYPHSFKCRC